MIKNSFLLKISLFVIIILGGLYLLSFNSKIVDTEHDMRTTVSIGGTVFFVDVVDTNTLRNRGLSGREFLGENEGMLFIFDSSKERSFWMKDMNFDLDMIWMDENRKIIDISKNVPVESFPESISPISPAQYVLEVNAGISDREGIETGDVAQFSLK